MGIVNDPAKFSVPPTTPLSPVPTEQLWDRNIDITTRLVDTVSTPTLLKIMRAHKIDPKKLITHHFKFADIISAYDAFAHAATTGALKVILEA